MQFTALRIASSVLMVTIVKMRLIDLKQKPINIIRWNEVALGAHKNVLTSHIVLKAGLSAIPHNDIVYLKVR